MMSLPDRSRALVPGTSDPGTAGSGICLTHTTTFMADHLCGPGTCLAIRPGERARSRTRASSPPARARRPCSLPPGVSLGNPECVTYAVRDHGVDAQFDHALEVVHGVDGPDIDGQAGRVSPRH